MALNEKRMTGSARWSALWGIGMLLVFVGERMIGARRLDPSSCEYEGGILRPTCARP